MGSLPSEASQGSGGEQRHQAARDGVYDATGGMETLREELTNVGLGLEGGVVYLRERRLFESVNSKHETFALNCKEIVDITPA